MDIGLWSSVRTGYRKRGVWWWGLSSNAIAWLPHMLGICTHSFLSHHSIQPKHTRPGGLYKKKYAMKQCETTCIIATHLQTLQPEQWPSKVFHLTFMDVPVKPISISTIHPQWTLFWPPSIDALGLGVKRVFLALMWQGRGVALGVSESQFIPLAWNLFCVC